MPKQIYLILFAFLLIAGCSKKEEPIDVKKLEKTGTDSSSKVQDGTRTEGDVRTEDATTEKQEQVKEEEVSGKQNTATENKSYRNVSPQKAAGFVGEYAIVEGAVADVYKNEKVAYLNFINKFPKNPFTAVIFANKFEVFDDIQQYKGKTVEVRGKITEYNGKPQIILNSPAQIKIVN